jgi:hypothetical protein
MKILLSLYVSVVILSCSFSSSAVSWDYHCGKYFDKYRQLRYWASIAVSVNDYKYGSGDVEALELVIKPSKKNPPTPTRNPVKPITDHFTSEFNRLLKGNLPFHDVDAGKIQRVSKMLEKVKDDPDIFDKIEASEEARRNALYGPNPGAIYCNIAISRNDFPVLYEIVCTVVANKDLRGYGSSLKSQHLGFSTPEHIQEELIRAITARLEDLRNEMEKIKKCPSK